MTATTPPTTAENQFALFQLLQMASERGALVQREENNVVQAMERLAMVTDGSVQGVMEIMIQVNQRLADAERREREVSALNDARAGAEDQRIAALQQQVNSLTDTVTALSRTVTTLTAQLAEQKRRFDAHYHPTTICCAHTGLACSNTPWQTQGPKIKEEPRK